MPILLYPDPSKPYVLFTDASKYAWSCVLTQEYTHEIGGKTVKILHSISYQSGLFKLNLIGHALPKKTMAFTCLSKNWTIIQLMLQSDHLSLKKFLTKNTLKVNNGLLRFLPSELLLNISKVSKILLLIP